MLGYADDVEGCEAETNEQTVQLPQLLPAAAAQGQLGLRQGRGLHVGHHRIFPQENTFSEPETLVEKINFIWPRSSNAHLGKS